MIWGVSLYIFKSDVISLRKKENKNKKKIMESVQKRKEKMKIDLSRCKKLE